MRKTLGFMALALTAGAFARTFEVTAWRGETVAARVPDSCEFGAVPKELGIRFGTLKSVKYAPAPDSLQRLEVYDRVVWEEPKDRRLPARRMPAAVFPGRGAGPRIVEVTVPADARPGVYTCGMMNVTVLNRTLPPPKEWKYYLDLWQHPWAVARQANVQPFSKRHYEAMRPVWELLATAGQKTITVSLLEQPWDHQCRDAYHSMFEDGNFRLFDEYVTFARSCGLGPDISCYSLCPWTLGRSIDEAKLEERWGAFLDRFAAHVKEKGWFANTIMAMDERAPEDVAKVVAFVRRHAPGMRLSMAGNRKPSDFKGTTIDVYAQVLWAKCVTPAFLKEAAERRAQGLVTTFYVCCSPSHPNTFLDSGDGEPFWCGAAPAFVGLDGFLRWAWNSWPEDPVQDASFGNWKAGDTFLCYPNGEPSWRFLELRNGIIAAEKARILAAAGVNAAGAAKVAALYSVAKANDGACNFRAIRNATLNYVNAPVGF